MYEISDGIMIYYLPKELDHYQADLIKRKSEKEFDGGKVKYLIFDFSETVFMDSSGIGLITGRYRKVFDNGGRVFAINVNSIIDRLLRMSGIYRIVEKSENAREVAKLINDW